MNLILLFPHEVESGIVVLPADDRRTRHILSILKPSPGKQLHIGFVNGSVGTASTWFGDDGCVRLEVDVGSLKPPQKKPLVELMLAAPTPGVMKRLWKSCAELGLGRIIVTNAFRVEDSYFNARIFQPKAYVPLLLEGLEQAAVDTQVPDVHVEKNFTSFVEETLDELYPPGEVLRLLCHPSLRDNMSFGTVRIEEVLKSVCPKEQRVILAIGPQGGWIDSEVELLEQHGFQKVCLGSRVLTTEVAVHSLTAVTIDALNAIEEKLAAAPDTSKIVANNGVDNGTVTGSVTKAATSAEHVRTAMGWLTAKSTGKNDIVGNLAITSPGTIWEPRGSHVGYFYMSAFSIFVCCLLVQAILKKVIIYGCFGKRRHLREIPLMHHVN